MPVYRKKLIEVNIPLPAINAESAKDASLTHGHPSTLHRYWARRPLAACRAVIFACLVDDPGDCPAEFPTETAQNAERERLHRLLSRLVVWKNSTDDNLLAEARYEIALSVARNNGEELTAFRQRFENEPGAVLNYLREHGPAVYDAFCGGGSIPLEAQRLGVHARGSDLNPLPVLLTKAMIELPPRFHNHPPLYLKADSANSIVTEQSWRGTAGLAADIRHYGQWLREQAHQRIGHLYPPVRLRDGTAATVVAWLWARTVPCSNPACGLQKPLMKSFQLSKRRGNEYWTRPVVDRDTNTLSWVVQSSKTGVPMPTVRRTGAHCCACGTAVKLAYLREQAKRGKMGEMMTAIVAESPPTQRKKLFLSPTDEHLQVAMAAIPKWRPRQAIMNTPKVSSLGYGMTHWHELFTERQLTALTTFSDLLPEVRHRILQDGAEESYADAVCTYLALAIGRTAEAHCSFALWGNSSTFIAPTFIRQAIPMIWDFVEGNPFSNSTQNWMAQVEWIAKVIEHLPATANSGTVYQADATNTPHAKERPVIVTDPPYYDNINYADLSDFFYVWLRPLLRDTYPELFGGMMTPKSEEIIAAPRFEGARERFEELLGKALLRLRQDCSDKFPTLIFYAYKQQAAKREDNTSTGWETMLAALVNAGFQIVATWPIRTEQTKALKTQVNALATSILLVCRPRPEEAPIIIRNDFLKELKAAMPPALDRLTRTANIRPVDLAQAAIGPGMAVYSRYRQVTRISGELISIREALRHINHEIVAYHEKETGELDAESQFCLTWLQQHDYTVGTFGDADGLSKAKGVDIAALHDKVLLAERGQVRLLRGGELAAREHSERMTAWEGCQRMVWHLSGIEFSGGIQGCVRVGLGMRESESAVRLARVLYAHYERCGDAERASDYNLLVSEWRDIEQEMGLAQRRQTLF